MSSEKRPQVTVEKVVSAKTGDITHSDPEWILAVEEAHKARASNSQRMGA
ncbi:hypothetical protein LCGC14_0282640 [marine sediment metagenome]|uniref:Uncharacterized protein n=1 Tax=marine sediment metagenome TaxID=412755 RepID=A0A0F9TVP2_9ZZZZ